MSPKADRHAMVPAAEPRTYYDQPVLKRPVWTVEVPWYFFTGGLAGASSVLATCARAIGADDLSKAATRVAGAGALVSPVLLISDLGRPERFYNMLRVFKPTSPMSVGSWVLAGYGPAAAGVALLSELDRAPLLRRMASAVATALGPVLVTYTAVLVADTAVPVWHEARRTLPFVFAGAATQSAAGAAVMLVEPSRAASARQLLLTSTVATGVAGQVMERSLGEAGAPYREDPKTRRFWRASQAASALGATAVAVAGRRRRSAAVIGGALSIAGAALERFAVFEAGRASAADPRATIGPQRARA